MLAALLLLACRGDTRPPSYTDPGPHADRFRFADPADAPPLRGTGAPAVAFEVDDLFTGCAFLDGEPGESLHHNLVVPYRGHLVMPWAPEWSNGGVSLFDLADPCAPVKVGEGTDALMRETHAMGFVHLPEGDPHAGDWAVVNALKGIQVWDLSDAAAPVAVATLDLPDVFYPDAYARVVLSVFVQYPYVYVAGADNGLYIVDMTDPRAPFLVTQYRFDVPLRAGGVFATGRWLLVSSAEQTGAISLDISDPAAPTPYPGGAFETADGTGEGVETYHANVAGPYALFARKEGAGGPLIYDLSDPSRPTFAAEHLSEGNGGYVFWDEGRVFVGESSFAAVYDFTDLDAPYEIGRADLEGDLDTMTPYGNVAILSVDAEADGHASSVVPWAADPDGSGPTVLRVDPPDGATAVRTTARVGVGFDEMIEPTTAFAGSIRLFRDADDVPVEGWVSAQEGTANYWPKAPLEPGTVYRVEVLAGGVTDVNGNPLEASVITTFTTEGG